MRPPDSPPLQNVPSPLPSYARITNIAQSPWGYADFLEAIADPQHEEHEHLLEWIGGKFDAEKFDPKAATKAMKKGLPDWRNEDEDF